MNNHEDAIYVDGQSFAPLTLDECIANINTHDNLLSHLPNGPLLSSIAKRNEAMLGLIELLRANSHAENADSSAILSPRHTSALILALDVMALDINAAMEGLTNG